MGASGWMLEAYAAAPRRYPVRSAPSSGDRSHALGAIALRPGRNRIALPPFSEPVAIDPYPPPGPDASAGDGGKR